MNDDEMIRNLGTQNMNRLGHTVETAIHGDDAVEQYSAALKIGTPFHLVIMDLTIPGGKGGEEAIQDLLKIDPHARAIVSSGYASNPIMANFSDYGFAGKLAKPFARAELKREIDRVMALE